MEECPDILDYFSNKYQGLSLFHHFAGDREVIELIYNKYMHTKVQSKIHHESAS